MPKKFKQIREKVRNDTLVPGTTPSTVNDRLRKNPNHARGQQPGPSNGQYYIPAKGVEVHTRQSRSWDGAQKDTSMNNKYSRIYRAAGIHEDGVAGGGGAVGSAAGGMVAGVNQTAGSMYNDPNIPYATRKKKFEKILRRKKPSMMESFN